MSNNKRKGRDGSSGGNKKQKKDAGGATLVATTMKTMTAASTATLGPINDVSSSSDMKRKDSIGDVNIDEHPLQIDHFLLVKYRDGSDRLAKIVERSTPAAGSTGASVSRSIQYYIHYYDFNRRMDEWINSSRILAYPSEMNAVGEARELADKVAHSAEQPAEECKSGEVVVSASTSSSYVANNSSSAISEDSLLRSNGENTSANRGRSNTSSGGGSAVKSERRGRSSSGNLASLNSAASSVQQQHQKHAVAAVTTVADMQHDEHEGMDEASLLEHEEVTKIKNIKFVKLGKYIMECWYFSPFPKEFYPDGFAECIYFCEFSMRFFKTKEELLRYSKKPGLPRYPPGNEIYRDARVSMFELDGAVEKIYCQNLCYFAKLFLDHKTLYWDVDPFLFYVLCTRDERGFHPVGYFSKEKYSDLGYNLACILTFPCVQRMGFGRFLIEFSYELSKKEEKAGSPEKPLSDLGWVGYRSYWAHTLLTVLKDYSAHMVSIVDLTRITSILPGDVLATLNMLGLIRENQSGRNLNSSSSKAIEDNFSSVDINSTSTASAAVEDAQTQAGLGAKDGQSGSSFMLYAPTELLDALLIKYPASRLPVEPEKLHWAPLYVTDARKDKWSIRSILREHKQAPPPAPVAPTAPTVPASTSVGAGTGVGTAAVSIAVAPNAVEAVSAAGGMTAAAAAAAAVTGAFSSASETTAMGTTNISHSPAGACTSSSDASANHGSSVTGSIGHTSSAAGAGVPVTAETTAGTVPINTTSSMLASYSESSVLPAAGAPRIDVDGDHHAGITMM
mmetsp:Transcript_3666/g.6075  ORF Transcript_3666/g.6075 Transcript_3666/m.6075 type:complete len:791 (-) Transcript_3666:87-2459(-)